MDETLAAATHIADCPGCRSLAELERQFRQLLRRQPRESMLDYEALLECADRLRAERANQARL